MKRIALISCSATKGFRAAPAEQLYAASDLFAKSKAYAEQIGARWFILSAKHGLVDPKRVVEPYDVTMRDLTVREKNLWTANVLDALASRELADKQTHVTILADVLYRELIEQPLRRCGCTVETPLANLAIGKQKAWLKAAIAA